MQTEQVIREDSVRRVGIGRLHIERIRYQKWHAIGLSQIRLVREDNKLYNIRVARAALRTLIKSAHIA